MALPAPIPLPTSVTRTHRRWPTPRSPSCKRTQLFALPPQQRPAYHQLLPTGLIVAAAETKERARWVRAVTFPQFTIQWYGSGILVGLHRHSLSPRSVQHGGATRDMYGLRLVFAFC